MAPMLCARSHNMPDLSISQLYMFVVPKHIVTIVLLTFWYFTCSAAVLWAFGWTDIGAVIVTPSTFGHLHVVECFITSRLAEGRGEGGGGVQGEYAKVEDIRFDRGEGVRIQCCTQLRLLQPFILFIILLRNTPALRSAVPFHRLISYRIHVYAQQYRYRSSVKYVVNAKLI